MPSWPATCGMKNGKLTKTIYVDIKSMARDGNENISNDSV